MKRVFGQALTVTTAALLVSALAPACAENDRSIFVHGVLAPSQTRTGGGCVYSSDPGQTALYEGVLDAAVAKSYVAVTLVGSQLMPRNDTRTLRAESNRTHLEGAVVRVTDAGGATLGEFTSLAAGFVDPATGVTPSFGSVAVTVIDEPTVAKIGLPPIGEDRLVIANIKIFGTTVGGVEVESGEYAFPIRVCNGCLVTFTRDPAAPDVRCPAASSASGGGDSLAGAPCRRGQDEPVPCQFCQDREICR